MNFRCSVLYCLVQRPLLINKKTQKSTFIKVLKQAAALTTIKLLWFYGLSRVGPLRANLLSEHSNITVYAVWGTLIKGNSYFFFILI